MVNIILPIPIAGFYNPDLVMKIAQISKDFSCDLKVTNRENFHLENVHPNFIEEIMSRLNQIEEFKDCISSETLSVCPGDRSCNFGLINTEKLAKKCHDILTAQELKNKFKISISGCPYPCLKNSLTDFGAYAKKQAQTIEEKCIGCDKCVQKCKQNAIRIVDDIAQIDYEKCIGCGKCFENCPNEVKELKFEGYQLFIGGFAEDGIVEGVPLEVETEEDLLKVLEKSILFTKNYSISEHERLGAIIQRGKR